MNENENENEMDVWVYVWCEYGKIFGMLYAHKHAYPRASTNCQKWGKVFENVLIMNVAFWIICGNKQSTKWKSVKQSERNTQLNERWFFSNDADDNCNGWLPWHGVWQIGTV